MAVDLYGYKQAKAETFTYPVDFADNLLAGATITGASAVHTPPSGAAGTPTTAIASPIVYVALPMPSDAALGAHLLTITPTVDNTGSIPDETLKVRLHIVVEY